MVAQLQSWHQDLEQQVLDRTRELKDSEARWQFAIEGAGDGLWDRNVETNRVFFSPRWKSILGCSDDDIGDTYQEWEKRIHPDDLEKSLREVNRHFRGETKVYRNEHRLLCKDGSYKWILARGKVMAWSEEGRPLRFIGTHSDITERKRTESQKEDAHEAIQASLREKEVLLREIHHRVKNNMQVISSLFNLQAGHTLSAECREILKEGQTRIRSMSLVHEKLYQSRDLSKIDLAGYIQNLAVHLFHVYLVDPNQVRLETDFEEVALDINSAVPCGLLLNELISNALKHAFPRGRSGVIKIGLRRGASGTVELQVADDGVGFPVGMDFRRAESFGLQIVNLLVGQLEATIEMDRTNGTAFTVVFHELKYSQRI